MKNSDKRICATPGCGKIVCSIKGRVICRDCHRGTVVWKNRTNQRDSLSAKEVMAAPVPSRVVEMTGAEAGDHILSLLRKFEVLDIPEPVRRYIRGSEGFAELERLYS